MLERSSRLATGHREHSTPSKWSEADNWTLVFLIGHANLKKIALEVEALNFSEMGRRHR